VLLLVANRRVSLSRALMRIVMLNDRLSKVLSEGRRRSTSSVKSSARGLVHVILIRLCIPKDYVSIECFVCASEHTKALTGMRERQGRCLPKS